MASAKPTRGLSIGGLDNVRRTEPMPAEVVQNRRYPDGLLRAFFGNDRRRTMC